jgi:hypothetical protein
MNKGLAVVPSAGRREAYALCCLARFLFSGNFCGAAVTHRHNHAAEFDR